MPGPQTIKNDAGVRDMGTAKPYVRILDRVVDIRNDRPPVWTELGDSVATALVTDRAAGTTQQR
jgi:hypothetical protein